MGFGEVVCSAIEVQDPLKEKRGAIECESPAEKHQ
jgi:hypothetical protein